MIYGLLIYASAVKSKLVKIEKAQRRILGAIFFMKGLVSPRDILSENKIPKFFALYIVEVLKELFKTTTLFGKTSTLLTIKIVLQE